MHLGMPECHKRFLGHCDLDLWPSFQELLCPEHICYIIWCRNPKFGVVIPLGMAEWCIPFWGTLTLALTSGLISRFFVLYYSYLSSNVSYARPIPLGTFLVFNMQTTIGVSIQVKKKKKKNCQALLKFPLLGLELLWFQFQSQKMYWFCGFATPGIKKFQTLDRGAQW